MLIGGRFKIFPKLFDVKLQVQPEDNVVVILPKINTQ